MAEPLIKDSRNEEFVNTSKYAVTRLSHFHDILICILYGYILIFLTRLLSHLQYIVVVDILVYCCSETYMKLI